MTTRPRGAPEMAKFQINRRKFLTSASLGLSGIALSG
ncbi:MAG: molybdopterin oxidoreductase, partial [Mesorhizobium sp.]